MPKLTFPGGALIGCAAGFVNVPRIKGSHNAMKTGMLAAEAVFAAIGAGRAGDLLTGYEEAVRQEPDRDAICGRCATCKPLWSRFGTRLGTVLGGIDMWLNTLFRVPALHAEARQDRLRRRTEPAAGYSPIAYPKPDGVLTFDRLSSVFLSSTNHEEDQPVHLVLNDPVHSDPASTCRSMPSRRSAIARPASTKWWRTARRAALPDQRAELRALQNLRHQGSVAEHHLGHAGRRRRSQLRGHVGQGDWGNGAIGHGVCLPHAPVHEKHQAPIRRSASGDSPWT